MKKEEYHQLLKDGRWQRRRLEIMQRDNFKCRDCGTADNLNVHHIRYIAGHKPWEYDDGDLITLCGTCHKKRHEEIDDKHYNCARCQHFHQQYLFGGVDRDIFEYDGCCKEFGGIGCKFNEAITCKSCAFQSGCDAGDEDIACDKFAFKRCLNCSHFQIESDDNFDGFCNYSCNKVSASDMCDDCNIQVYSPVALNNEDLKKYIIEKGWD